MKIVDAHHHLWSLSRNAYPWLTDKPEADFFLGDYTPLKRDFLPADYRRQTEGYDIVATVHVEAEFDRSRQVAETAWLHEIASQSALPSAVIGHAWLADQNCETVLAAHAAFPLMRGIRSKPVTSPTPDRPSAGIPGSMRDPLWRAGFALLQRYGLSFDLRVPYWHLEEAAELAARYPETPIAINHTGLPWDRSEGGLAAWRAQMSIIAEAPQVHVKISEFGHKDAPWNPDVIRGIICETIEIFGVERCMFASNLPVCLLSASFEEIVELFHSALSDLTLQDREKIMCDNAAKFYNIDIAEP